VSWAGMAAALMLAAGAKGAHPAPKPAPAPPGVEVVDAAFGLFKLDDDGTPDAFHETANVPDVPGQAYGWMIQVKTRQAEVHWRETFTLPAAPRAWGLASDLRSLSDDGRTSVTDGQSEPEDGAIRNVWLVAPGDPVGTYVLKVTVEGAPEQVFQFEVK
jgi:hypothetical protein